MKLRLGGTLEIGDPLLIAYGSAMEFGLFAGYGRGTIQYYTPSGIIYQNEAAMRNNRKPKFYKAYIHGNNTEHRVAKVNPEVLHNQDEIIQYEKAIDILKQYNFIQ
jgi:hypothetical protein